MVTPRVRTVNLRPIPHRAALDRRRFFEAKPRRHGHREGVVSCKKPGESDSGGEHFGIPAFIQRAAGHAFFTPSGEATQ